MLERILDKYYAKKVENQLEIYLRIFRIDSKFIHTKDGLELYLKKKKWKDKYYREVMSLAYKDCFDILVRGCDSIKSELLKYIKENLED